MKQRPLPKTVTPLADELLSGWLTRLAVTNHCEVDELLAHIGVDTRQVAMLDFEVELAATIAEKISFAARVAAETVQSLNFGTMTETEALMTVRRRMIWNKRPDFGSESLVSSVSGYAA